jgi:hypothetical protein
MRFHSLFPGSLVGVLRTPGEADAVLRELKQAGFAANDWVLLTGRSGLDWLDVDGRRHGRWGRFVRKLQRACSEGEEALLQSLSNALSTGRLVLIVMTHGGAPARERVRTIVGKHGGEALFYCGSLAIEEIPV